MKYLRDFIENQFGNVVHISFKTIILNAIHPNYGHVSNLYCLILKQLLHRNRCTRTAPNEWLLSHEIQKNKKNRTLPSKEEQQTLLP